MSINTESAPNASAAVMGEDYCLTAVEMNMLLKEQGYLDGEPGAYGPTEKGKQYVHEDYVDTSSNSGYWQTTWDPSIKNELDLSEERRQQAREAASARRAELSAARAAETDNAMFVDKTDYSSVDSRGVAVVGVVIIGAIYGIKKAAPKLKTLWMDKITPRLEERKNRNADDANTDAEIPDSDEGPST